MDALCRSIWAARARSWPSRTLQILELRKARTMPLPMYPKREMSQQLPAALMMKRRSLNIKNRARGMANDLAPSNMPMQELRAGQIMPNSPQLDGRPSPRMPAPPIAVPPGIIPNLDLGVPVMPEERMAPPVMNQMEGDPRMMMAGGR